MPREDAARRLAFAAIAAAFLLSSALAGDPKVAESLLKSGKQALSKGEHESAATFFTKAFEEDDALIEACWWRGQALEKAGDKAAALTAYRQYLSFVAEKAQSGSASREELRLRGLAEKSVDVLAAGEKEFRRIEDAYVASLMQFAKDNFVRDPSISAKALAMLAAVRPDYEEAAKLRAKLGGGAEAPAASSGGPAAPGQPFGPFKDVRKWRDLIAEKTIKDPTYANGLMTFSTNEGTLQTPGEFIDLGENYAYEHEFRLTRVADRGWLIGLVVGWKGGSCYTAFVQQSSVVLCSATRTGATDLVNVPIPEVDPAAWHRFGVTVRGPEIELWLDGKKHVSWRRPDGAAVAGEIGIYQQTCTSERRVLRAGRFE
jgi:hypothetical protein